MRSRPAPFQIDIAALLGRAKRSFTDRIGEVTLNFPFISVAVSPKDTEQKVARELVIRLKDRRVLSAYECCDGCIDEALKSLQEIRGLLVDKQVELLALQDGPLYLVVDMMREGIRQFLTFEQSLKHGDITRVGEFRRPEDVRQAYFDGLELLRGHLAHCLTQVAAIAGIEAPREGVVANYHGDWPLVAYVRPQLPSGPGGQSE
ncbi:hypothetical protein [Caulobacter vibrioides]|nr:hypothetical protein [Caulobacter vibrioides]